MQLLQDTVATWQLTQTHGSLLHSVYDGFISVINDCLCRYGHFPGVDDRAGLFNDTDRMYMGRAGIHMACRPVTLSADRKQRVRSKQRLIIAEDH